MTDAAVVADFSFAWPNMTAAGLRKVTGLTGFIAYAGGVAAIVATGLLLAAVGNRLYRALA